MRHDWGNVKIYFIFILIYMISGSIYAEINSEALSEADMLITSRKYREAINLLEKIKENNSENPVILIKLAAAKIQYAGFDSSGKVVKHGYSYQALRLLSEAVRLAPNNIKYKVAYSKLLYDLDHYKKALQIFLDLFSNKGVRKHKIYRYLVISYADTYNKLNRIDEGLLEYRKSLDETDYDERIFFSYIGDLSYAGKLDEMMSEYKKYEENIHFSPNIKYKLCKELLANKKYLQSKNCYNELLKHPQRIPYISNRSRIDLNYVESKLK